MCIEQAADEAHAEIPKCEKSRCAPDQRHRQIEQGKRNQGKNARLFPLGRRFIVRVMACSGWSNQQDILRPLFAVSGLLDLESDVQIQRGPAVARWKRLDVNEYLLTSIGWLNEPESALVVPSLKVSVKAHFLSPIFMLTLVSAAISLTSKGSYYAVGPTSVTIAQSKLERLFLV